MKGIGRDGRGTIRKVFVWLMLAGGMVLAADRPNIVWMVSEDNGARWLGCYGNPAMPTPNLDKLAEEGFRYTRAYASVPVCAPQRFTWITGMNAISVGTQGMRGGVKIPESIQFYPEIFRRLGYYTSKGNDSKEDYNFGGRKAGDTWNERKKINWETLEQNQPFLHVFNTHDSHEWNSFGMFNPGRDAAKAPKAKNLAAYHPDIPEMRFVYEKYTQAHRKMDQTVAGWLQELEDSGMAENTIVVYSSDHGGVLPRSKRYLYNSGTHCPLIVRIPQKYKHLYPADKPGMTVDELVSFVDFPKTLLGLAGASADDVKQMQGRTFLGSKKDPEPQYVYSFRNRMDDRRDMVRSVRDRNLLYIRNYMPFAPVGQYQPYCYNSASTRAWRAYHLAGKTNAVTGRFFQQPRAVDELYGYTADYDNVKNLAPDREKDLQRMLGALRDWQLKIYDTGFLPEMDIEREANKHGLTVYEFARKPQLYPLASYIDMADRSLELNLANLPDFLKALTSEQLGLRYWATLGIVNLSIAEKIDDAAAVVAATKKMLAKEESEVIQAYAAWLLIRHGESDLGIAAIRRLGKKTYDFRTVVNIVDWMKAEHAVPLARELYLSAKFPNGDQVKIVAAILKERGSAELAGLVEAREKLRSYMKAREGRLKKLAKSGKTESPEKIATEKKKAERELAEALEKSTALNEKIASTALF